MNSSKQIAGLILGIFSFVIPYMAFYVGMFKSMGLLLVSLGVGFVMGLIALILSVSSMRQARELGHSKAMSVGGIVTSIIGMVTSIGLGLIFGGTLLLASALLDK